MLDFFFKLGVAAIGIYLLLNFTSFILILLGIMIEAIGNVIKNIFGGR